MKTLHFEPTKVSHTLKTPRSKFLESDGLSSRRFIATQSLGGEGGMCPALCWPVVNTHHAIL